MCWTVFHGGVLVFVGLFVKCSSFHLRIPVLFPTPLNFEYHSICTILWFVVWLLSHRIWCIAMPTVATEVEQQAPDKVVFKLRSSDVGHPHNMVNFESNVIKPESYKTGSTLTMLILSILSRCRWYKEACVCWLNFVCFTTCLYKIHVCLVTLLVAMYHE